MPTIHGIRVVRSEIDGYGVIATRSYAEGDIIAEVEGVLWREGEEVDDRYSLIMGGGFYLDMVDQTRWINHSCDPNAEVETADDPTQPWARIVAIRDIAAGDEIAYDYGFAAAFAEPCYCRAENCRGLIIDPDEMHLLPAATQAEAKARAGKGNMGGGKPTKAAAAQGSPAGAPPKEA